MPASLPIQIFNATRATMIADKAELARTFAARGLGLMGRTALPVGFALIIYPEWSVHTFFMLIPIDVVFVDKDDHVVGLREKMPPNRPFAGVAPWRGKYVIELPAGVIRATNTQIGDALELSPHP